MKIIQIEDFFHPDAGYQVNVLTKYLVKSGYEVSIFTSEMKKVPKTLTSFFGLDNLSLKDKAYEDKYGVKITRFPLRAYALNRYIYTKEIFRAIKETNPDIIFVHGNDSYIGLKILMNPQKYHCAVITDSHMLKMASTSKFSRLFREYYKRFVTPKIIKNNIPVIRTQNDDYVEACLGIPLERCPFIPLGSDVLLFHPDQKKRETFRRTNNISSDAFVFTYAGKLDEAKGADLLAKAIKERFVCNRDVVFLIVGNAKGEFGEKVETLFNESENRIIRYDTQSYENLAIFFQASDIAIFPKQCSLSFYDAQACALPVISENNNINIERNSHDNGFCFNSGDYMSLHMTIQKVLKMDRATINRMSSNALQYIIENFNYEETAQQYMAQLENIIKK